MKINIKVIDPINDSSDSVVFLTEELELARSKVKSFYLDCKVVEIQLLNADEDDDIITSLGAWRVRQYEQLDKRLAEWEKAQKDKPKQKRYFVNATVSHFDKTSEISVFLTTNPDLSDWDLTDAVVEAVWDRYNRDDKYYRQDANIHIKSINLL